MISRKHVDRVVRQDKREERLQETIYVLVNMVFRICTYFAHTLMVLVRRFPLVPYRDRS